MAEPRQPANFNMPDLIEKLSNAGLNNVAIELEKNRPEIEDLLANMNPYSEEDIISMIVNYSLILYEFYRKEDDIKTNKQEEYQLLLAATFSVGYAVGQGVEVASVLPIMAIAGTHSDLGKKIIKTYLKEIKAQNENN
ncbi:MAG: hypothetical protein AB7D28_10085 [Candidatus Berkiella sp.]